MVQQKVRQVGIRQASDVVELILQLNKKLTPNGRKRAKPLLERLEVSDRLQSLPAQYSSSQKQRVAIARCPIHVPVVLAGDPTATLDTEGTYQGAKTFSNLIHEQNRIGIMVTHDLRMCRFVDRVIQMSDGQLSRILSKRASINALVSVTSKTVVKELFVNGTHPNYPQTFTYPVH